MALSSVENNEVEKKMKVAYKVWIDSHGQAFGEGPYELLIRTRKTGSLHQAAHQMGMSYSKAWKLIQIMEKRLGFPLLYKRVGGLSGGGSNVSAEAEDLIERYARFRRDVKETLEMTYQKHFGSMEKRRPPGKCTGVVRQRIDGN